MNAPVGVDWLGMVVNHKARKKRERDPKKVRDAVRDACLSEFRQAFGVDWNPKLEAWVCTDGNGELDRSLEKKAKEAYRKLGDALEAVDGVIEEAAKRAARRPMSFDGVFVRLLQAMSGTGLLRQLHSWLLQPTSEKIFNESRSAFAQRWDYDTTILHLPNRADGTTRFMTPREFAIVSLLGGHWPGSVSVDAMPTALEVIAAEEKHMRLALTKHGVQRFRMMNGRLTCGKGLWHDWYVMGLSLAREGDEFVPKRGK